MVEDEVDAGGVPIIAHHWPCLKLYMVCFKFILGLKCFELVSILLAIVPDYNEYTTKENKNKPVLKILHQN